MKGKIIMDNVTKINVCNRDVGLWKAKDVADFLNCSSSWVYHRAEAGELPCVKIGAMTRFIPEDIRKWCEARRIVPAAV